MSSSRACPSAVEHPRSRSVDSSRSRSKGRSDSQRWGTPQESEWWNVDESSMSRWWQSPDTDRGIRPTGYGIGRNLYTAPLRPKGNEAIRPNVDAAIHHCNNRSHGESASMEDDEGNEIL